MFVNLGDYVLVDGICFSCTGDRQYTWLGRVVVVLSFTHTCRQLLENSQTIQLINTGNIVQGIRRHASVMLAPDKKIQQKLSSHRKQDLLPKSQCVHLESDVCIHADF